MKGSRALFVASWLLLCVVTVGIAYVSISSTAFAYTSSQDRIGELTFDQIRSVSGEEAVKAIRGRRATAATWALAYSILMGWVVLAPYRRRERWAWWALLFSLGLSQLVSLGRAPMLGTLAGTGTSGILLAFLLLGLLAGAPHMFSRRSGVPDLKLPG